MSDKKIYLIEKVNEHKTLVTVAYTTSIKQLYLLLKGRMAQGGKPMPYTQSNLTKRLSQMQYNVPNVILDQEPYRVTKVKEYRKS